MAQNLKQFLKDFEVSHVAMNTLNRQANVRVAKDVVERFIACMKDMDPLFKELFQNIIYVGSFYEGLRVNEANEFDLDVILKLPFKPEEMQVVHERVPNGFVMYKLKQGNLKCSLASHPKWSILQNLDKLMDTSHQYLSQNKLNTWFQSLVDRTLEVNARSFQNVKRSCSGPAKTLNIIWQNNGRQLEVDLVPVVKFAEFPGSVTIPCLRAPMPTKGQTSRSKGRQEGEEEAKDGVFGPCKNKGEETSRKIVRKACGDADVRTKVLKTKGRSMSKRKPKQKSDCYIVPKPPPDHVEKKYGRDTANQLFRVSIPYEERLLMNNIGCFKMLVKIFKAIRDKEHLTFLASYYIKTVFMWQLVKHPQAEFWNKDRLDELFLMMLREFVRVMTVKRLDHIFFQGYNQLADIQQESLDHAKRQFEYVLQQAEFNVPNLYKRYDV